MSELQTVKRKKIAFIHTGSFYHLADLKDPVLVARDVVPVYAPELQMGDLQDFDSIFLACRQHPAVMERIAPIIVDFLSKEGRRAVIGGENQVDAWLPGVSEKPTPTIFWAWRTGEDLGRREANRDDELWEYLNASSVHWHFHGALTPPATGKKLVQLTDPGREIAREEDPAIIFVDRESFGAQVVVTSMDPCYHHGAGFMPGATQLLYRLLQWLG